MDLNLYSYRNYIIKSLKNIIISQNIPILYGYLEDMCQDVFVSAYENLDKYNSDFNIITYINLHIRSVIHHYKKKCKYLTSNVDNVDIDINDIPNPVPEEFLSLKEKLLVSRCIHNYRYRLMYDLVYSLENEKKDVANFLGITVESLRVYLSICNQCIRKYMLLPEVNKRKVKFPPDEFITALLYSDLWTASVILTRYIYGLQIWEIREKIGLDATYYWKILNQLYICEEVEKKFQKYKESVIKQFSHKNINQISQDLGIKPSEVIIMRQILGIQSKGRKAIEYDITREIPKPRRIAKYT